MAQIMSKLEDALRTGNFEDVEYFAARAYARTGAQTFDYMSTRASKLLKMMDKQRGHSPSANAMAEYQEQIKLRENLLDLDTKVFGQNGVETRENLRALAKLYYKVGRWADAEKQFAYLIKTGSDKTAESRCWVPLANALMQQKKYQEAFRVAQHAVDKVYSDYGFSDYASAQERYFLAIELANKLGLQDDVRRLSADLLGYEISRTAPPLEGWTSGIEQTPGIGDDAKFLP
jgi:tetratricopeptide (TPR) repeat protein